MASSRASARADDEVGVGVDLDDGLHQASRRPCASACIEHGERLVKIEGRAERSEVEVEMGHLDRDVGLDPDDDGLGAAQTGR